MTGHSSDPSIDVDKQRPEAARLAERCIAYKGQVEAGAAEIARLTEWNRLRAEDIINLGQEIARLTAALEEERQKNIDWARGNLVHVREQVQADIKVARLTAALALAREALDKCQKALAVIVDPKSIKTTSVMHAWAHAQEAECEARTALSSISEPVK